MRSARSQLEHAAAESKKVSRRAPRLQPRRVLSPNDKAPLLRSGKPPKLRREKRALDLVLAAALIVLLAPLLILLAFLVKLDGGPVLYGCRRIGSDGRSFRCWKFRSMVVDADRVLQYLLATDERAREEWNRDFKLRSDPRVTVIGRFLRKTSLDELPQLFNVVTGSMSLVGPRPIVEAEIDRFGRGLWAYFACRPGITGLWQIAGRNDIQYARRVELNERYTAEWSIWLDLAILSKTVVTVARRSGAY